MNIVLILLKWLFYILVFPGFLFCIAAGVLLSGLDRKLVARMQKRVGPPILQPLYDFLKLAGKETIIPKMANRKVFLYAPVVGLISLIITSLFIPFNGNFTAASGMADMIVVLYLLTIPAVSIMVGAAASGSPWAGVGMSREMVSVMAYELPLVIILLCVAKKAGAAEGTITFSLSAIAQYQAEYGSMITKISMIPAAIAMLFVIPCEAGAHPLDVAEAETEICEGTLAEYSGFPLGLFELSHYVKSFILTSFFCALFLGGFTTGVLIVDIVIRLVFCFVVTFISMTLPHGVSARFKTEQIFKFYWTVVAGLAFLSLVLVWIGL